MFERFWFRVRERGGERKERERDGNAFMIIFGEILNERPQGVLSLGLVREKVLKVFGKTKQFEILNVHHFPLSQHRLLSEHHIIYKICDFSYETPSNFSLYSNFL